MQTELEGLEVQPVLSGNDDFPIQHTTCRQLRPERVDDFRKIAVQRLLIAALDVDFIPVPEDQGAKPVPLRFENPLAHRRQLVHALGEHRQDRWVYGEIHASSYTGTTNP